MKRFWAVAMSMCLFTGSFSQMGMTAYAEETVQSQGANEQAADSGNEADNNTEDKQEQVTDLTEPEVTPEIGETPGPEAAPTAIPEAEETEVPEASSTQMPDLEEGEEAAAPSIEPAVSPSVTPQATPVLMQEVGEALVYDGDSRDQQSGGATTFASESSGTLTSDGKYRYKVTDSPSKLATLTGYFGSNPGSDELKIPYEINGYYMSELGSGVFTGMNKVDSSDLSKLYSVKDNYSTSNLSDVETYILNEMNKERISRGLHPLVMDTSLHR